MDDGGLGRAISAEKARRAAVNRQAAESAASARRDAVEHNRIHFERAAAAARAFANRAESAGLPTDTVQLKHLERRVLGPPKLRLWTLLASTVYADAADRIHNKFGCYVSERGDLLRGTVHSGGSCYEMRSFSIEEVTEELADDVIRRMASKLARE